MPGDHFLAKFSNSLGVRGLRWTGRMNVPVYRLTRGRITGRWGQAPILLLTTTGRKSGEPRTAPVLYLTKGDGLIVIDTNAGNDRRPGWSANLAAEPLAKVQIGGRISPVRARIAEGEERERLWQAAADQYEGFDDYIDWTDRKPRVWVLEPPAATG